MTQVLQRFPHYVPGEKLELMDTVKVFTDGGSRGNPGPAAIGILILDDTNRELERFRERIGNSTNNRAEYQALLKGLELAAKYTRYNVYCYLDSELVANQVKGVWRLKKEELRQLFRQVKDREQAFQRVIYTHVRRDNAFMKIVDRLVNEALDETKAGR